MSGKAKPGDTFGRWTYVRSEGVRSDGSANRPRCLVRCTCGVEQVMFTRYLRMGRSSGCSSGQCREAWRVATEVVRVVKELRRRDRELGEQSLGDWYRAYLDGQADEWAEGERSAS